ncbi:uncharacterized protein LOC128677880 isoform X2 [Plodia interpunctella]|uniref:uncharacterized protein LOC128677880 isoform X2 n=1 Tax=Plodia interpunctella TaxID=58824 RepID=UPI002367D0CF|nr:uncharacterized protein LOC128677880 isoform X2 [Plodia interpunctella]
MKRKRAFSDSSSDVDHDEQNLTVSKLQEKEASPKITQNDTGKSPKSRPSTCKKKRKRAKSNSSSDIDDVLPENTLEIEKSVIAAAVKNNLDDAAVKKILKKVVTNDHVLALVKLQEEEEQARESEEGTHIPKLTRSKVKELKKASSCKTPWDLERLELTPIKHIPVKTRPEVTALIAQELPEDEDDDEYHPANTTAPSDDDVTLESCSDVDSQPRTPATPTPARLSPRLVKDGPFKVPQELTPARRKLNLEKEEEATIALRTRSKLCLSETPIEHIESSFIPPDDIPVQVDDLWSQFLAECLDPALTSRHEDDDDADPEYNVAADPDANEEDEEALESSIIKISKKELNDLVTELFNIMPEDDCLTGTMNDVVAQTQPTTHWEGKQEQLSDEETTNISGRRISDRITFERRDSTGFSIGKIEPPDDDEEPQHLEIAVNEPTAECRRERAIQPAGNKDIARKVDQLIQDTIDPPVPEVPSIANMVKVVDGQAMNVVNIVVGREAHSVPVPSAPLPLQKIQLQNKRMLTRPRSKVTRVEVHMNSERCILPEQIIILQQQLRQHVQLAASNFMQLYVHPLNYGFGPTYKSFLESLVKIADKTPNSVADVCNLRPAMQLVNNWQAKVSENTPENREYIQFIQDDCAKWSHYLAKNNYYMGDFHPMYKKAIAESSVFLYPYLLPPKPYHNRQRRHAYLISEDELITLGLEQFWQYVVDNPKLYPPPRSQHSRHRWWLNATLDLISQHMLPFLTVRMLLSHVANIRKQQGMENPVNRFFANHEVKPVEHRILPYNSEMTLCDQPVEEMPKIWLRYLAKHEPRFRKYLNRHKNHAGAPPIGIPLQVNLDPGAPIMKAPLPLDFTKVITTNRKKKTPDTSTSNQPTPVQTSQAVANNVTTMQTAVGVATNVTQLTAVPAVYNIEGTGQVAQVVPLIIQVNAAGKSLTTTFTTTNKPIETNTVIDLTENCNAITNFNDVIDSNSRFSTTTVSCKNAPISSTTCESTTQNDTEMDISNPLEIYEELSNKPNHCECCILLRKVCKRQTKITEYFKEKTKKSCFCKDVNLPRITKKLIQLVNSFKDPYRIAMDHLEMKLEQAKDQAKILFSYARKRQNKLIEEKKYQIEDSRTTDVEDLSYVTGYKMKLMARLGPNIQLKSKVHSIFSTFNANSDDPLKLAKSLNEVLTGHHTALFRDFLPFLTKEQAARVGRFKDYFALVCVADLVKMVEEEIVLSECRRAVLQKLHRVLTSSAGEPTACQICTSLLPAFYKYPHLAQRVFRLFPHTLVMEEVTSVENNVVGRRRRATNTQKDKQNVEVSVHNDVSTKTSIESEKDHACRAETNTAEEGPRAKKPECEKGIIQVSKDTSQVNVDIGTENVDRNSPDLRIDTDNTAQEDMDITFCSDSTPIPSINFKCVDSPQRKSDDNCGESTQNDVAVKAPCKDEGNDHTYSKSITSDAAPSYVSQEKEKRPQEKTYNKVADASKHTKSGDSSQEKRDESGNSSQNVADVTLCGERSQLHDQADMTLIGENSQMHVDYEADQSCSGEDEDSPSDVDAECEIKEEPDELGDPDEDGYIIEGDNIQIFISDIKSEADTESIAEENPQTIKQEELDSESETSMAIDTDEETIKSETTEWLREEDKLILQVIKDNITKEQRGDKPILEFIEDNKVIHLLSESLTHKSETEIKDRIIYLLQILLLSD